MKTHWTEGKFINTFVRQIQKCFDVKTRFENNLIFFLCSETAYQP